MKKVEPSSHDKQFSTQENYSSNNEFNRYKYLIYGLFIGLFIFGIGGFYFGRQNGQLIANLNKYDSLKNPTPTPIQAPTPKLKSQNLSAPVIDWLNYYNPDIDISFDYPAELETVPTKNDQEIVRFEKEGTGLLVLTRENIELSVDDKPFRCFERKEIDVPLRSYTSVVKNYYFGGGPKCSLEDLEYIQGYTIGLITNEYENDYYYLYYFQPDINILNLHGYQTIYDYGDIRFARILSSLQFRP